MRVAHRALMGGWWTRQGLDREVPPARTARGERSASVTNRARKATFTPTSLRLFVRPLASLSRLGGEEFEVFEMGKVTYD
jgi:hypothetical protein